MQFCARCGTSLRASQARISPMGLTVVCPSCGQSSTLAGALVTHTENNPDPIRIVVRGVDAEDNPVHKIDCPSCGCKVGEMEIIKMAYGDEEDTHVLCCANCNAVISKEGRSQ